MHRNHRGMYANRDLILCFIVFGNCKQLHRITKTTSNSNIGRRNLADALAVHITRHHIASKCDAGDDRYFCCCVQSLNICSWVGFGITECLSTSECVGVALTLFTHLCEDVICCAINNAENALNGLATQTFAQWAYEWNATTHCCLKQQVDTCIVCCSK